MSVITPDLIEPDYASDYVVVDFEADEQDLADTAAENLQATWPGWQPNDGDMEVVLIETLSPMAAAAANAMNAVPPAALIALASKLWNIPWGAGSPATTTVALSFVDDQGGYVVPAGSEFELGGYAFSTVEDVASNVGSATVTGVDVVASDVGAAYNELTSADWANVTMPVWVVNLLTEAPTSDGVDPQDANEYLDMVSRELQLRGRMIVTLPDYEIAAVNTAGVGRAFAIGNSAARSVVVYLTDPAGEPVPTAVKTTVLALYSPDRILANVNATVADANYTTVAVTYHAVALQGFDPAALRAQIDATLTSLLSPMNWGTVAFGQPGAAPAAWLGGATVYLNKIIAVIGAQPGVDHVVTVTLNGAAADLAMTGPVALPRAGTMTGTVDPAP